MKPLGRTERNNGEKKALFHVAKNATKMLLSSSQRSFGHDVTRHEDEDNDDRQDKAEGYN